MLRLQLVLTLRSWRRLHSHLHVFFPVLSWCGLVTLAKIYPDSRPAPGMAWRSRKTDQSPPPAIRPWSRVEESEETKRSCLGGQVTEGMYKKLCKCMLPTKYDLYMRPEITNVTTNLDFWLKNYFMTCRSQ